MGKTMMFRVLHKQTSVILLTSLLFILCCGCQNRQGTGDTTKAGAIRTGYSNSPLLGTLYAIQEQAQAAAGPSAWQLKQFGSGGDIGYALISGEIDAGFVETDKALQLLKTVEGKQLKVAGAVEFPYGATLVVRKDLNIRLADLSGRHLAALEADCIINHQFNRDARRHGLDPKKIRYSYLPFADMLPALEAGAIDGALVKGAYGVLAELAGHKILYQNWDIKAGSDDCCPPAIAQTEFLLVVREKSASRVRPLVTALLAANDLPPMEIRAAVSRSLGYPAAALEQYPVATFAAVGNELRRLLGEQKCLTIR
jgi:ABC-type nitrate/sulfonate/bicarbonate transport system substrate-binding protein